MASSFLQANSRVVEGDREGRSSGEKGREVHGRREKRGRKAGFSRWREAEERGEIT